MMPTDGLRWEVISTSFNSPRRLIRHHLFPALQGVWTAGFVLLGQIIRAERRVRRWTSQGGSRAVIVAPHPDDETVGAGGVAALHVQCGDSVTIVVVTDGGASRAGGLSPKEMVRRRTAEVKTAATILGVSDLICLGLREGEWDKNQARAVLGPLLTKADIIYAPSCVDFHIEHIRVARVVADLLYPSQIIRVFEVGVPLTPWLVNLVADVREVASLKRRALEAFVTQVGALTPLRRLARYQAGFYRMPAVEVFWELTAAEYARVIAAGDWRGNRCPFRGIRERPMSDPLSALAGLKARLALRNLIENFSAKI